MPNHLHALIAFRHTQGVSINKIVGNVRYPLQIGKTYGMGVPVKWIEVSLFEAIQLEKVSKK